MRLTFLILFFVFIDLVSIHAQDFIMKQYRASDGLQTDMIKSINRDTVGYIWIGTDNGLVKYNGISFAEFPEATSSQYIKDLIRTKDGRLLVVHDMGIIEVKSSLRTVEFTNLINGATVLTDTALWYPKNAYEDKHKNIWIAEPQSIVKVDSSLSEWKRYKFTEKDNSVSFVRSFNFIHLSSDSLLISSFKGNYFIYHYSTDQISSLSFEGEEHEIHVLKQIDDEIFAGTNQGLSLLQCKNGVIKYTKSFLRELVTDIEPIGDESMIICSENGFNYYFQSTSTSYNIEPIKSSKLNADQAFAWNDNVWLSTQKGVALLKKPIFRQVKLDVPTMYVEAITSHPESPYVYMLSKEILWRINKKTEKSERIFENPGGYLLSGAATSKGVWVTDAFDVLYIENGKIKDRISLKEYGRFVFNIIIDNQGIVWMSQEASKGVKSYNPTTKQLTFYDEEKGFNHQVTNLKGTDDGVYITTNEDRAYLYYKPNGGKFFRNISFDKGHEFQNLQIEAITIKDSTIWMGSNYGILRHGDGKLSKDTLPGNQGGSAIRALVQNKNHLWYGNQLGLYRYDIETGNYNLFNEETGLSANSINEEGILLTGDKLWVGTPFGISVMDYNIDDYKITPKPFILSMLVNGKSVDLNTDKIDINYGAFIKINYASLTYPSDDVQFSYRIVELDKDWSKPSYDKSIEISGLENGDYSFQVRARKLGNYKWSNLRTIKFYAKPALYQSWWFYMISAVVILFFAFITRDITKRFMKKRQKALEKLVEERTAELEDHRNRLEDKVVERTSDLHKVNEKLKTINTELHEKNDMISSQKEQLEKTIDDLKDAQTKLVESEKMASLGILTAGISHEINNPLNFIMAGYMGLENYVEELDDNNLEQLNLFLESIKTGVDRASDIVKGLNQFARDNESYEEECNIESIVGNCILMIDKNFLDDIEIIKDYTKSEYTLLGNLGKMHQVFLNLIMNAAQAINGEGEIKIKTELNDNKIIVTISDNGEGISDENLKKIQDPFFTTKDPGEGTGLGLSITSKIIREHNGKLEFRSKIGEGTVATVSLPLKG